MKLVQPLALLIFGMILVGCAAVRDVAPQNAAEATEIERITEIAVETCGSQSHIENVSMTGFVCRD